MDFFNLVKSMQSNIDPLNFLGAITATIVSLIIFRKDTSTTFSKERHDNLIFPLFDALEPILYQRVDVVILNKALDIIAQNRNLADGKLIELHYLCSTTPSQENFNQLCFYIDKAYDRSCRKLMLKRRSIAYRINRSQYKNKTHFALQMALYVIRSLAIALISFFLMMFVLCAIMFIYNSLDKIDKIYVLIPLFCFMLLTFKFISKDN